MQGLKVLAELVEFRADVQEHDQDSPVCRVVTVVFHVALHLQRPVCQERELERQGTAPGLPQSQTECQTWQRLNIQLMIYS